MRILLATEGESDEVVAQGILTSLHPDAQVEPKRFPARGFSVVKRLMTDTVRAAHFGFYDLLVVHFDLDDTLPPGSQSLAASPRWQEIRSLIDSTLGILRDCNRPSPLLTMMMTPLQSTDAWLYWGQDGGDGTKWEQHPRHILKELLYGRPPIGLVDKSRAYTVSLLDQMGTNQSWPLSLREFWTALTASPAS